MPYAVSEAAGRTSIHELLDRRLQPRQSPAAVRHKQDSPTFKGTHRQRLLDQTRSFPVRPEPWANRADPHRGARIPSPFLRASTYSEPDSCFHEGDGKWRFRSNEPKGSNHEHRRIGVDSLWSHLEG